MKRKRSTEGKLARRMQRLEDQHRRDMIAVRHECVSAIMAQHDATVRVVQRLLEEYLLKRRKHHLRTHAVQEPIDRRS